MTVLVTGGTGYIGSHTAVVLLEAGYPVVLLDNLVNSKRTVLERIERVSGCPLSFVEGDVRDADILDRVFRRHDISAVIHFAGLKAVGESVAQPLLYYDNNVAGSLRLFEAMARHGCHRLVFSSSATVYGDPATVPIREDFPLSATNPYGRSKLMIEDMLRDLATSDPQWRVMLLRYFNPVGAHPGGLLGEDPEGTPNNLMPYVARVAAGQLPRLQVFGDDYPTPDGTGVRDYIHVMDLARGHLAAMERLAPGCEAVNLGTGRGYSVLEVVRAFAAASGREIPYEIAPRRAGDVARSYADTSYSRDQLGWEAKLGLEEMVRDHWNAERG